MAFSRELGKVTIKFIWKQKKIAQSFQSNFEQKEFRYQNTLFQDIYKSIITKTEWNCHKCREQSETLEILEMYLPSCKQQLLAQL